MVQHINQLYHIGPQQSIVTITCVFDKGILYLLTHALLVSKANCSLHVEHSMVPDLSEQAKQLLGQAGMETYENTV